MNKKCFFVLASCVAFCFHLQAQNVIKGFEYGEIMNIAHAYRTAPNISFDMQINYADSANQDSIVEQVLGSYKIQNGKYWAIIDSVEMVQGNSYNVSASYNDSVIYVTNPHQNANLMQLPFLDSLFRAQNVDSMTITQVNDSTRSLRMYFNPASFYSSYIINYDLNNYMMHSITYFVKTPAYEEADGDNDSGRIDGDEGSGISMINIIFNNYSYQVIDNSYFQEDKFIYKQGGQFFIKPPYTGFQLMVNIPN